jgi:hypothetical protein
MNVLFQHITVTAHALERIFDEFVAASDHAYPVDAEKRFGV